MMHINNARGNELFHCLKSKPDNTFSDHVRSSDTGYELSLHIQIHNEIKRQNPVKERDNK
jgi:hypothetical protein